ncbi:hypothetical protein GUITHDRAFT_154321 [Guillardia theta CCMP2712]|uniref:EF-hand domain-containing protein n=1 Tax=Guillardia theta (strain CCMP2712) TaxID=905079 RepID=L1IUF5_GUITC|nr:hypothetical protein GUITHDRAFT_154321 [Guillardia theta CCMP2712]EKX39881.1 hypothetical protein GUITHDRAFT_154321 [Guillardia theta CCMP2712]|eukprot:XP_005826861.1 hypothetical protein GUITHDRAFT_154321 [Guillardia theta CCMP2712]
MELGVSRCELFILFMSHKYVKSANCRREYVRACEAGKYIIPVFVPVLFKEASDSESGWRGDKGKEWWKSIADVEGKAAEGNKVDWNHLKHFPKTFNLSAGGGTDEIQVLGVEELVAAVQARVYRGDTVFHEEAQEEGEKRRPKKVLDRADHFLYEFRRLDLNGDGELSADELFEGLRFRMSQDEVSRLFDCMDANGDGRISMEEFIDARKKMIEDTIL